MTAVAVPLVVLAQLAGSYTMQYFPGDYFDSNARSALHRRVLDRWPGPSALLDLWHSEDLTDDDRALLLLGGAAFHDRQLLRAYAEATRSDSRRVRQAAAYGYRYLVGDAVVDVTGGVDEAAATQLRREIRLMNRTLRERTLVEVWLNALLATEGKAMAGWSGVSLKRARWQCATALERLVAPEDLGLAVGAYRTSDDAANQQLLLRVIQGLAMRKFLIQPQGARVGWGPEIHDRARLRLEGWLGMRCAVDFELELRASFQVLGIHGLDPMGPESCGIWQQVLLKGEPEWWSLAAQQLYRCGGPGIPVSMLENDAKMVRAQRDRIVNWYRLR